MPFHSVRRSVPQGFETTSQCGAFFAEASLLGSPPSLSEALLIVAWAFPGPLGSVLKTAADCEVCKKIVRSPDGAADSFAHTSADGETARREATNRRGREALQCGA